MVTLEQQQILAVWEQVKKRLLPAVLSDLQTNADYIKHYMSRNALAWTTENMLTAIDALSANNMLLWDVDCVVAPKKSAEEIDAEFRAKEIKRVKQEEAENRIPFSERTKKAEEARKHAELKAKAFQEARDKINGLILNWTVNAGPGRIDEGKSAAGRAALREIHIGHIGTKVEDPTLTLAVIQKVYHLESADQIRAAVPKAIAQLGSGKSDVTIVGNLPRFS
jgi:hypothetical protein